MFRALRHSSSGTRRSPNVSRSVHIILRDLTRWQPRLIDDVPIPETAVVRTDIAQIVQASQPCREHPTVAHAVLASNRVLLGLAKAVEQRRQRAEVPHLAGHPDRQW